jgi:hypothetical protein
VRTAARDLTFAALTFAAVLAPWWAHSALLYGRFVPLDTTAGLNLAIGLGPGADGQWTWPRVAGLFDTDLRGVDVTTPAGSQEAATVAMAHVRAEPLAPVRLVPSKLASLLALEGREHAYLYSIGYLGDRDSRTVWSWGVAVLVAFPALLVMAVLGACMRQGLRPEGLRPCVCFAVAFGALHLVAFGDPRFHLPLVPVLAVLATGVSGWRAGAERRWLVPALLLVLWLGVAWVTQFDRYWTVLTDIAQPGGWTRSVPFIDLI